MKEKEEEEIGRPDKLLESYLAVQKRLMKLMAMPQAEHIKLEKLEAINQAITNLEQKETLGKHTGLTGKEKKVCNSPDYSPTFAEEPSADPSSLKERDPMKTTPGFKFQPNDEEIIQHLGYKHSNSCQAPSGSPIKDCSGFYVTHPGHLPDANSIKEKKALYYYVLTNRKSGNGDRIGPNGYWRATGNKNILSETGSEIGYRRTLKYFEYPDENQKSCKFGKSTNWMMHEYRLATTTGSQSQEESLEHWTVCKVTWTGKNIEVPNDFSREGSIGPLENKHKNEGDPKISKIVDSKREEISQTNDHSIGDEFGGWTQEKRGGKLREQRMNRKIHQSEEVTPCYASGIHSTSSIMVTTHEVETEGVEPQQFEKPGKVTIEFGPSISEQTSASGLGRFLNSDFIGREDEDESQSCLDPFIQELTSASWVDCFLDPDLHRIKDQNQAWFDPLPIADLPGMEDVELNILDNLI